MLRKDFLYFVAVEFAHKPEKSKIEELIGGFIFATNLKGIKRMKLFNYT